MQALEREREIMNNIGLFPKILVLLMHFSIHVMQIKPIRLAFIVFYRLVDLAFCKLLLNYDISAKAKIRHGLVIYYPYGIFISADTVIDSNFTCRAQVTIGNKETGTNDDCPTIGNNVNVEIGAKSSDETLSVISVRSAPMRW